MGSAKVQEEVLVGGRHLLAPHSISVRPDRAVSGNTVEENLDNVPVVGLRGVVNSRALRKLVRRNGCGLRTVGEKVRVGRSVSGY